MEQIKKINVTRYHNGQLEKVEDLVVQEYPLTIFLNGEELLTLLCTPQSLEYLAIGFLVSEGFLSRKEDIKSIKVWEEKGMIEMETYKQRNMAKDLLGKRTITTGCGKGTTFYHVMDSLHCHVNSSEISVGAEKILALMGQFNKMSDLFLNTGGTHSAALSDGETILLFHEDVGRHNAVDKIIGECMMREIHLKDKLLITSGRISSEILIKAAKRGIPIIVSRSAPTDLAVQLGEEVGITVVGFARGNRMNVYSGKTRIVF